MSATALLAVAAEDDEARWTHWQQRYTDSSRRTAKQVRLLITAVLIAAVALLVRALLAAR